MSSRPPRGMRAGLVVPLLISVAAVATCLGLGTWQIQRKAWKEALIDTLERRLSAAPVALPLRTRWAELDAASMEFLRVTFPATFVPGVEALVYAAASTLRPDVVGLGYWVLAPVHVDGGTVVVNRGFVPEGRRDPATRASAVAAGAAQLIGVLRWPEQRRWFSPSDDPGRNLWFVRDPSLIAGAKGWGEVAPFYVELESPQPEGGLPRPGRLEVRLRNDHLQYAVTWYGMAGVIAVMFIVWLVQRSRRGGASV